MKKTFLLMAAAVFMAVACDDSMMGGGSNNGKDDNDPDSPGNVDDTTPLTPEENRAKLEQIGLDAINMATPDKQADLLKVIDKFYEYTNEYYLDFRGDFEDSGLVTFDFVNGGMGCLNYSTSVWNKNMESSLLVVAENGSVKIGGQYMNEVEYCHIKDYEMPELPPTNPGNDYGPYKGSAQNHNFVIRNVVEVLTQTAGKSITTNVLEGLKVVDIIQRIYACKAGNEA